jgi:hypothetical protein
MKTTSFAKIPAKKVSATLISVCLVFVAMTAQAGGGKLTFKDAKLKSGNAGADGAVYQFDKVESNVNALVTIKGRSSALVRLVDIDMKSSGFDKAWQPIVSYNNGNASGAADWWMEFEFAFVDEKTGNPVTIEEFDLSAIDIDGNGDRIREYVSFYNLSSYTVEASSLLGILKLTQLLNGLLTPVGVRFDGPTRNFLNIDTSGTAVMATTKYLNAQKFTMRAGAVASGSNGAAERMYSFYFQDFKYNQPAQAMLPVNLKTFDATVSSSKVNLEWATADEVNFSHFVLQRSSDGREFSDAAMIMANAHSIDYKYNYSESYNQNASAVMYYRLKMVDIDGTFKYSAVRVVKLNASQSTVSITTFPNPVTSELRITIPAAWQNKQVTYDVLSVSGSIIKRKVAANASQTETLQVNDIKAGVYVVRLTSGSQSATQQVVKR